MAVLLLTGGLPRASAFSLLGDFTTWQTTGLNYGWDLVGTAHNLGGPMNLGEEYRWNVPVLYYGFDRSFLDYFGSRGALEVEKAAKIINDLPPASQMDVDTFPLKTERTNFRAQALGLLDLKSAALQSLVQELGVADPEAFVFCLRSRFILAGPPPTTNYYVIKRNFDPVTLQPSSYINGDLWTYTGIADGDIQTVVVNTRVDPLSYGDPVSSDQNGFFSLFNVGNFYTGLTREDVGALRYIYHPLNKNVETPIAGAIPAGTAGLPAGGGFTPGIGFGTPGSPWIPILTSSNVLGGGAASGIPWAPIFVPTATTNAAAGTPAAGGGGTNLLFNAALRSGVDKVRFVKVDYDSLLGQFVAPFLDTFTDTIVTNSATFSQVLQRIITQPDVLFSAADLFTGPTSFVFLMVDRTPGWQNNGLLNRPDVGLATTAAGPGTINPTVTITFNNAGPAFENGPWPFFLSEADPAFIFPIWGSFDGTTNAPVVYPNNVTIEDLERKVLGGR